MYTYKVTRSPAGRSYLCTIDLDGARMWNRKRNIPQSRRNKAHRTSNIHRIPQDIKRETLYAVIHQNTEVVPEESSGNSKGQSGSDNKQLANSEQNNWHQGVIWGREHRDSRLVAQSALISAGCQAMSTRLIVYLNIQMITKHTK
jgi:hypothetical protein